MSTAPDERIRDLAGRTPTATKLALSFNIVFPLLGGRSTWSQEHLLPIAVTLVVALLLTAVPLPGLQLMMTGGTPAPAGMNEAWQVFTILAVYIAFIINYYINQMCGRARPGWLQALVSISTFCLLTWFWPYWYDLFYLVIPGQSLEKSSNALAVIAGDIFSTGLAEEGFKALPLMVLALMSVAFAFSCRRRRSRLSVLLAGVTAHFGLREPLDGIVLGAASGSGFFVYETLVQYVPMVVNDAKYPADKSFDGLVELLGYGLPELSAHSAYTGFFGYFIGLSVLRPGMAVILIPLGWLSAALLHGAWDATSDLVHSAVIGVPIHLIIGVLSYGLLAGAIFKAREISPSFAHRCARLAGASGRMG